MDHVRGAIDAVYRFLASLKLAVISLSSLAAVAGLRDLLRVELRHRRRPGCIYQSTGSPSCWRSWPSTSSARRLIRYPWKKRQTGFVITHAGLLILSAARTGASRRPTRGRSGCSRARPGTSSSGGDDPVIRVREVDPHTQEARREYELPFKPGPFAGGAARPICTGCSTWS